MYNQHRWLCPMSTQCPYTKSSAVCLSWSSVEYLLMCNWGAIETEPIFSSNYTKHIPPIMIWWLWNCFTTPFGSCRPHWEPLHYSIAQYVMITYFCIWLARETTIHLENIESFCRTWLFLWGLCSLSRDLFMSMSCWLCSVNFAPR